MDTKKAIQKVKDKYEGWQGQARSQEEVDELGEERDEVIALLQQGKAYRLIVEGFEEIFYTNPYNWVTKEYYRDEIEKLKQKYLNEVVK